MCKYPSRVQMSSCVVQGETAMKVVAWPHGIGNRIFSAFASELQDRISLVVQSYLALTCKFLQTLITRRQHKITLVLI